MDHQLERGQRKAEKSTEDRIAWTGFECKWLECVNLNCKIWMSMMVPYRVDMEHEVLKCGRCTVKYMNELMIENEKLGKEVDEMRLMNNNKEKEWKSRTRKKTH